MPAVPVRCDAARHDGRRAYFRTGRPRHFSVPGGGRNPLPLAQGRAERCRQGKSAQPSRRNPGLSACPHSRQGVAGRGLPAGPAHPIGCARDVAGVCGGPTGRLSHCAQHRHGGQVPPRRVVRRRRHTANHRALRCLARPVSGAGRYAAGFSQSCRVFCHRAGGPAQPVSRCRQPGGREGGAGFLCPAQSHRGHLADPRQGLCPAGRRKPGRPVVGAYDRRCRNPQCRDG